MIVVLALMGTGLIITLVIGIIAIFNDGLIPDTGDPFFSRDGQWILWFSVAFNVVVMGILPMLWVRYTRVEPREGMRRYLQIGYPRKPSNQPAAAVGIGLGLGLALALALLLVLFAASPWLDVEEELPPREVTLATALVIALFVSLAAGFSEEVFFRGFLMRYVGLWGQAGIFALFHAANGPIALVVTFAIGLGLGALYRRGMSIVTLMVIHATYDMALLSLAALGTSPETIVRWW
jgi:membrane protease YdiL (CAAX protease family)